MPTAEQRELLVTHLEALRSDQIREFLRRNQVGPLGRTKEEAVAQAKEALGTPDLPWDALIAYLDEIEPYGKQHVVLMRAIGDALRDWSEESVEQTMHEAGLEELWQQDQPLAAPDEIQLSSVRWLDGQLEVYAISRRLVRKRRLDLDDEAFQGNRRLEAVVYERVPVRSWVRLHADPGSGRVSVHMAQLTRKSDYQALFDDFMQLISGWFPVEHLEPINLGRAVKRLHEAWEAGRHEASPQKLEYESADGIHSSLSSSTRQQSVLGQTDELDEAAERMRDSGPGAGANLYFLGTDDDGPNGANPIEDPIHVEIVVREDRINFRRPVSAEALDYILRRIRLHAG
jgi:hypothetical protein